MVASPSAGGHRGGRVQLAPRLPILAPLESRFSQREQLSWAGRHAERSAPGPPRKRDRRAGLERPAAASRGDSGMDGSRVERDQAAGLVDAPEPGDDPGGRPRSGSAGEEPAFVLRYP